MFTLALGDGVQVESICQQAAPLHADGKWKRSPNRTQAVLLIRGLHVHVLRDKNVVEATEVARRVAKRFPQNSEVAAFLAGKATR